MAHGHGYGFREVLIDQPSSGQWMEVDMNLAGGGHSTFQGTKFSDFAGGFSYHANKPPVTNNRYITWRTLNDTLELTETSMDFNLTDNQVRYIFPGSPIVGPITIHETDSNIVILVATVTSVTRFVFTHPKRIHAEGDKSTRPSIFYQICNKPQVNFRSFHLYEHSINIPVPLSATCFYLERGPLFNAKMQHVAGASTGECFFAFSFENGSIHVYKISREDILITYDLRQANLFTRILTGFTTSLLRSPTQSNDAAIGMNFFLTPKCGDKTGHDLQLVTLSMNGQLNLWICLNIDTIVEWSCYYCGVVDNCFGVDNYTDSCMLLRKYESSRVGETPVFTIYIPNQGFSIYKVQKLSGSAVAANTAHKVALVATNRVPFPNQEVVDFCLTGDYLFVLINNPEEEIQWDIKFLRLESDGANPRFTSAILERLPQINVEPVVLYVAPKEFYMNLIFDLSSFTAMTITKALSMFRKEDDEPLKDKKDWESLRITAMNIIDREIALQISNSEFEIPDDEFTELSLKYWLMFYNSCVEYHIHTVKPLGLFFEESTKMLCVVKRSRTSFLRPTDLLETVYYFPQCFLNDTVDPEEDERSYEMLQVVKYMKVVQNLESILDEGHISKIDKRLRENVVTLQAVCKEIAHFIIATDTHSFAMEDRQLVQILVTNLTSMGECAEIAMKKSLELITTWEDSASDIGPSEVVDDSFMGSRIGAHLTHRVVCQLMEHRFLIARDTMILQFLLNAFFSKENEKGVQLSSSWGDQELAKTVCTTYYALLNLVDDPMELAPPFIRERGQKVANILKLHTADTVLIKSNNIEDVCNAYWPSKLLEGFCLSSVGTLSIRGRVSRSSPSSVLSHAHAAGRCIWPNENSVNRPLEDFLIVFCQYKVLIKYANCMVAYFNKSELPMKHFYLGLANLCIFKEDVGLNYWRCINFESATKDAYFRHKILHLPPSDQPVNLYQTFYVPAITIVQSLQFLPGVQKLAEDAIKVATTDQEAVKMCSLAFKYDLQLDDYNSAYRHILNMPSKNRDPREKIATLRMFVSSMVTEGSLDTLLTLDMGESFTRTASVREEVEAILFAQANLSDPLEEDGVYQMLYAYHLTKSNFHKAANLMYYKAMRIGDRGNGNAALLAQLQAYLDVVSCLSLVEPELCRSVIKKTGITREPTPAVYSFDPSGDDPTKEVRVPCLPEQNELIVVEYKDIKKELLLLQMLHKTKEDMPVKPLDFERRAQKTVQSLATQHCYDDAIKLATVWNLDVTSVISYFADVCCNLFYNIAPEGSNPAVYVCRNDLSALPSTESGGYTEVALRLLESYLKTVEKPTESVLHQIVALKFLAAEILLPQWLMTSYKIRNVRQLLNCLVRYGEWEIATDLALKILDAGLGRARADQFDMTIVKVTTYDATDVSAFPLTEMNQLASQLKFYSGANPGLMENYKTLKERASLFCSRVNECTNEKKAMFSAAPERK